MVKISLNNRRRIHELDGDESISDKSRDMLLATKLDQINKEAKINGSLLNIKVSELQTDPNQPRKSFKNIESLASSIKYNGIIQPILVRLKKDTENSYFIIAGERRFHAAILAGLTEVPCIIREENDSNVLILQLLENDQREKVSPFEEADALIDLIYNKKMTKSELAKSLGHEPSWISIRMKLSKASLAIRNLADTGLIEDTRTLYELKKLQDEMPVAATDFIDKVNNNKISGSYRSAVIKARNSWNKKILNNQQNSKEIKDKNNFILIDSIIYSDENKISFSCKDKKNNYDFEFSDETIQQLKNILNK